MARISTRVDGKELELESWHIGTGETKRALPRRAGCKSERHRGHALFR